MIAEASVLSEEDRVSGTWWTHLPRLIWALKVTSFADTVRLSTAGIDDLDDGSDELGGSVDQWGRDDVRYDVLQS
jgi:hypothetical protein